MGLFKRKAKEAPLTIENSYEIHTNITERGTKVELAELNDTPFLEGRSSMLRKMGS